MIAFVLIVVAVNFCLSANLGPLEGWRSFCAAGVVLTSAVLVLSTYGRYRKVGAARRSSPP